VGVSRGFLGRRLAVFGGVVMSLGVGAVSAFAEPAFAPVAGSPFALPAGANPLAVAFSPDGKWLAVANSGANTLSVFSVGANGGLTPVSGSPIATGKNPVSVAFHPSAPFIAVANAVGNSVSMYVITGGGIVSAAPFALAPGRDRSRSHSARMGACW
jgi:hypothetical protein